MNRSIQKRALALALVVAMGSVHAQSTTGSIVGSVGQGSGTSVLVENNSGFSREVPVDARGRYTAGNLPLGTYKVTVKREGAVVETRENVAITVGANTDVSFAASAAGSGVQTLDSVTVSAASLTTIDVSSVDTRTVVTAEQLQQLPLGRTAEAIALLAPGVVVNSGGFDNGPLGGSLPSFGGSAASENAYYLNGFNTTTISNNLGGLTLPYGAIDQQEIFTGGYGAQYGRANGGVINQIGKRGTNEWKFGAAVIWEPNGLKANQRDIYWRPDSQGSTINNAAYRYARAANGLYQPASEAEANQTTYSAYVGGPIIQDKLFFFLAAEQVNSDGVRVGTNRDTDNGRTGGLTDYDYKQKRWYAKVDWNITDNHLIEVTGASDVAETNGSIYRYDYVAREAWCLLHRRIHLENRADAVHRQVHRLSGRQPHRDRAIRQDENAGRADAVQLQRRQWPGDQQRRIAESCLHRRHTAHRQPAGHFGQLAGPRVQKRQPAPESGMAHRPPHAQLRYR